MNQERIRKGIIELQRKGINNNMFEKKWGISTSSVVKILSGKPVKDSTLENAYLNFWWWLAEIGDIYTEMGMK